MALKKTRKDMLISSDGGQNRVAVLEDDSLVEIYIDRKGRKSIAGNIYRGRISNVLPGMSSAFVDISVGKNALLYFQDLLLMEDGSQLKPRKISKVLSKNDTVVVQVTKDPIKGKGARLTTNISIPGRLMVYIPQGNRSGVSRRLPERERERLRRISKEIRPEEGSIIIRTAAQKARKRELVEDLEYCRGQWVRIQKKLENTKHPGVVYTELDLPVRVIRDNLSKDFRKVLVDSEREYSRIVNYLKTAAPDLRDNVERYKSGKPLFTAYRIEEGIEAALRPKVSLPSGGSIVIDEAEALTAIDVNTGSYTGRKSLEDTVLKTNLEAVQEVVHQLRFRNIGGLIIIDLIDMETSENREKVYRALQDALRHDKAKTNIFKISELGLVEMTRKRTRENLVQQVCEPCSYCEGKGYVISAESVAFKVLREIRKDLPKICGRKIAVSVNDRVAEKLLGPARKAMHALAETLGREIEVRAKPGLHQEQFEVIALDEGPAIEIPLRWLEDPKPPESGTPAVGASTPPPILPAASTLEVQEPEPDPTPEAVRADPEPAGGPEDPAGEPVAAASAVDGESESPIIPAFRVQEES